MGGIVIKRGAVEKVMVERHARKPKRTLGWSFEVQDTPGFAHANAVPKELDGLGDVFDDMAGHDEVKGVVLEGQLFTVQVRPFEREPIRQGAFRLAVIHPEVLQLAQPKVLRRLKLPEADAANIQDLSRARRQLVGAADLAWRPWRDDLPDSHKPGKEAQNMSAACS